MLRAAAVFVGALACAAPSVYGRPSHSFTADDFAGVPAVTRTYYIQAEEVAWNYAPTGFDNLHGVPINESEKASVYLEQKPDRVGPVRIKALYREYTDDTFTTPAERPEWLGFLGPIIRAEVGDTVQIVFRNLATEDQSYSIHAHGVFYDKNSEGAVYADGVEEKSGDAVEYGETYTYTWEIKERAGPAEADGDSVLWGYHSHVLEAEDTYSGLMGAIIIYKKGALAAARKANVREFVALFSVIDENNSNYIDRNIEEYTTEGDSIDKEDEDFVESNLMHSINGRMYNNLDGLKMCVNDKVRWYVLAFGNEVDLHTVHWHGQTLTLDKHRVDSVELLPATFRALDMVPDDAGKWLFHCHVNDHIQAGMTSVVEVFETDSDECRTLRQTKTPFSVGTITPKN